MELVDLTGIWRDGEFYKVQAIHQCRGCEFYHDAEIRGRQCYDILCCEGEDLKFRGFVYIKTDDESVAKYIQLRMDYEPRKK